MQDRDFRMTQVADYVGSGNKKTNTKNDIEGLYTDVER